MAGRHQDLNESQLLTEDLMVCYESQGLNAMPCVQVDSLAEEVIDKVIIDAVCDVFRSLKKFEYV